jgi:hypothetical protein
MCSVKYVETVIIAAFIAVDIFIRAVLNEIIY